MGGPTTASAWISHVLGVVGLMCLGCMSSIAAPPSTIGVDVLDHPDAAEEPLFKTLPLPAKDSLVPFAIARRTPLSDKAVEETDNESSSYSSSEAEDAALYEVTV